MSTTTPKPQQKQSLQFQIAKLAPTGSIKYQIEVHSPDGGAIRVFPRKTEGRTYYSLRPFQSPYMCPFGQHVIRFYNEHNERLEVPDDEFPTVRLGPRDPDSEAGASDDNVFDSPEWLELRREKAQQEIELGTQQLLINQQNINEHGDVTRSTGQLLRRHHEYVVATTAHAMATNEKISAMNDRIMAQGEKFLETTTKIMSHFMEIVEKVRVPAPPTDWAKVTDSVFNGISTVGSTLIAAAKSGEALPPGVVAARDRKKVPPTEPENKLPTSAAVKPIAPPKEEAPAPPSGTAPERSAAPAAPTPTASAAPAPTAPAAPAPKPEAMAAKDQEPPDPPVSPSVTPPEPTGSATESETAPAPAEAKPKLSFRQKLRLSVRNMIRYFLSFSPGEYVAMLDAPEEIAEYVDALSTLAVPHREVLAGLTA